MKDKLVSLEAALAPLSSGATLALGGSLLRRQPNAAVRALIRRGVKDLTLLTWATTTATDLLAAAGAVKRWEGIYAGMFNHGLAPNFRRGVESGAISVRDFSECAIVARFRAAAAGLAFMPVRSLLGSDMAAHNAEQIRPMICPFTGDKLHAVAAAEADFTIIHGYAGDRYGNVQWPVVRDSDDIDQLMASAAKRLIVTVEKIIPHEEVKRRPTLTYIPGQWVEAIVEVPQGAHPAACDSLYDEDEEHLRLHLDHARTVEGMAAYLDRFVLSPRSHDEYLAASGAAARLPSLSVQQG
jgi:glutaconate CoA-transferase, subunit A